MINDELPLWRLNLLRAFYLLVAAGLIMSFGSSMLHHGNAWALRKGETAALLSGLAILYVWGLRYPLQMLPLLVLELVWKAIWLLAIALPLWQGGAMTPDAQESAYACLAGIVLTPLVLPWRHIAHHYFAKPAQRWR
jgi:hypothetical protein